MRGHYDLRTHKMTATNLELETDLLIPYSHVVSKLEHTPGIGDLKHVYRSATTLFAAITLAEFEKKRLLLFLGALTTETAWCDAYLRDSGGKATNAVNKTNAPVLISAYRRLCDISVATPIFTDCKKPIHYGESVSFVRGVIGDLHIQNSNLIGEQRFKQLKDFTQDLFAIKYEKYGDGER